MKKIENLVCWQCGRALDDLPQPFGRRDQCPDCGADLHVCRLCESYDPRVAQACREPLDDTPKDKRVSNYCEWFVPRPQAHQGGGDDRSERARSELEALFGLSPGSSAPSGDARKRLDDLFGDDD